MEGPELATHQGRCDGASAIGDHRGPTHRHALARVRPDRPASAVSGTFSESTPSLSTLCAMENFRGDPTGPALAVLPQPPPTGSAQGSAMVAEEDARKEPVRTYVGLERTAHVSIGASEGNTCGKREKNAHFVSPKSEAFWGLQTGEIARQSPDRIRVGNWWAGRWELYRSCFGFFSQLVCLQLPTPVWSGGPTVGGTPTPSPRYPMMMNPSIDASSIDSSIDSSIANSPVRVHELGVKLGELLDDAANVLL